ncbi:MAG: hypothetical protein KatS3mg002_0460 [Candidatus Woesearchaeota archaeon]|nr:MAG: hypothetical protein KatS3mg002_0460 [Candidatus Woesearchaeota archaeon]
MYIKEKFNLLVNVNNIFNVNPILLRPYIIEDGVNKIVSILEVNKSVIYHKHFDKIINGIKKRDIKIVPINYENYILPVSYNLKTNDIIINIHPLGVSDISSIEIDPRNLYALVLYGLIFRNSFYKKITS